MDNDNSDKPMGFEVEFKNGIRISKKNYGLINRNITLLTECIGVLDEIKNEFTKELSTYEIEKIGKIDDLLFALRKKLIEYDTGVITSNVLNKISKDICAVKRELVSVDMDKLDTTMSYIVDKLNAFSLEEVDIFSQKNDKAELRMVVESFEDKVRSLENKAKMQQARIDKVIDQFKSDSQNELINLTKIVSENEKKLSADVEKFYQISLKEFTSYTGELEILKNKAQSVVNVICSIGLAGEYKKVANKAEIMTWVWQGITAAVIVFLVYFSYEITMLVLSPEVTLVHFMPKLVVISIVALIIRYTGAQVRFYQEREDVNRKIQLELESLEAYLSALNPEEGKTLKAKLADNYFVGRKDVCERKEESVNFSHWTKEILELVRAEVKKADK